MQTRGFPFVFPASSAQIEVPHARGKRRICRSLFLLQPSPGAAGVHDDWLFDQFEPGLTVVAA